MEKLKLIIAILVLGLCSSFFGFTQADTEDSEIISISLVNQIPDPAPAGETVEVRFMVENLGGKEANNITLEFIQEYPFTKLPSEEYLKVIRTLSAYQDEDDAVIIKYKLRVDRDASGGIHKIKIRVGRVGSLTYVTRTFDIGVSAEEFAQIIYIDKAKLNPGEETKLKFTISNIGNSPLKNLVFSWNEEDGVILPVYSDNTKYTNYIDVGGSTELEYIVVADVNAVAGLYQLNLNLEFEDENGTSRKINTIAGVFVGGETDFDVTFSESSGGQTSLSVANTGNNPALSVTVRIPNQEHFRVSGSTASIIGNLDKGDYTIVSFQITQASSAPTGTGTGTRNRSQMMQLSPEERQKLGEQFSQRNASQSNNLKVLIEYTDTTGVRRTVEKIVPIRFRSITEEDMMGGFGARQQSSIWENPAVIASVIVSVLIIGVLVYKKRRGVHKFIPLKGRNKK